MNGKPTYTYNFLGLQRYTIASNQRLPAGKATIGFDFDYDGGGVGKGGTGTLYVNNRKTASGGIERTQCCGFSADEGVDVGADEGTPVTEAYKPPFKFSGAIYNVTVEQKAGKKADIDDEQRARKAAAVKRAIPVTRAIRGGREQGSGEVSGAVHSSWKSGGRNSVGRVFQGWRRLRPGDGGAFHRFRHAMAAKVLDERFRRLREFCLSIS